MLTHHLVLGLIFLKYNSDTFSARRVELIRRFADEADDYFPHECDDEMLVEELEGQDCPYRFKTDQLAAQFHNRQRCGARDGSR